MLSCTIAEAVPTFGTVGDTSPTGRFVALGMGVYDDDPGARMAKVTLEVLMSPQSEFVRVVLSVTLAVLFVELRVHTSSGPVYNDWPVSEPINGDCVMV